jgi:hypothetical protein
LPGSRHAITVERMKTSYFFIPLAAASFALAAPSYATGLATCASGAQNTWQSQDVLTTKLKEQGWQVRRIKVDGGCYEVYALDGTGKRVEAYFHPRTLAPVPVGSKEHKG